jgi:ABC-type dipeptide/oligopeptide/nickel transport system, ATPase component
MTRPLLEVKNLTTRFRTERGTVTAVDGVSFHLDPGETLRSSANPVPARASPHCRCCA